MRFNPHASVKVRLWHFWDVAVCYSLSAEISLRVSMLSDRVAERAATSNIANNVRDKYRRTKFELDGLPAARTTGEREALIT